MSQKQNILFLCTGNACRSQMAEGLCRELKGELYNVYSAGIDKHGLNSRAVSVMAEINIDISNHHSKTLDDLRDIAFDQVVTVCSHANANCPVFKSKARVTHVGFDDPPKLAENARCEDEVLSHFRRVRDDIRGFILSLPQSLTVQAD